MSRFRLPPCARFTVAALLAGSALLNGSRSAGAVQPAARSTSSGVVSLGLERVLQSIRQPGTIRFKGDLVGGAAGAARPTSTVRVEVTSWHDVASTIRHLGGRIETDVAGTVTTAVLPVARVPALAHRPGVLALFPVRALRLEGDQSVNDIRANQAWSLVDHQGLPTQGQHVLIGVVDGGVDYHSPDFKNPDGSSRIRFIWDQTKNGHAPAGFSFGFECDAASINSNRCPERDDSDGHGTHVLGIAAGNGRTTQPAREMGVAPEANIVAVKSDLTSDNVIAAWKYLIDKAQQLHEPIVINNSFGDQDGPHNGSEPEALAIDRLSGPGRIFVKSAGNAGHQGAHASGTVGQGGTSALPMSPTGYSDGFDLEVFYPARDALTFAVRNVDTGEKFGPVKQNGRVSGKQSKDGDTRVTIQSGHYSGSYREAYVYVRSGSRQRLHGHFMLIVGGQHVVDGGRFNAWMQGQDDAEFRQPSETATMSVPGDAHRVITVGNYATSTSWTDENNQAHQVCDNYMCLNGVLSVGDIAASSSEGPTADGRQKPDIAAPGTMITSTMTHDAPICTEAVSDSCIDPEQISADGKHLTYTGTSMAAPHVTGTIALMLQANPRLTAAAADAILRATARRDAFTGPQGWNPAFGAGKLDALAAVKRVLSGTTTR